MTLHKTIKMRVFIADYLPLANKGEEEILRGIEALYSKNGDEVIAFSVFGDVKNKLQVGNVTIYPKYICYPDYKVNGKRRTVLTILWAILNCFGYYPYRKSLSQRSEVLNDLRNSDTILIGHDGFFNLRCAMLGNYIIKKGLRYGILGARFNKPSRKIAWAYNPVFKKCFDNATFVILREQTAYNYVKSISKNKHISLYPDPAFFCPADKYDRESVARIKNKYNIDSSEGMKIGLTVCEDSISFSKAFVNSLNREYDHRVFIAKTMEAINEHVPCTFYFLPHCIKEGKGNDLAIAKDIKVRLKETVRCEIIEEDMPVLDLKHIISLMDLVIGERTHSIINSIATATPFVCLTCSSDFRTHDIVGNGCGLPEQVYNMDFPDEDALIALVNKTVDGFQELVRKLQTIGVEHESIKKNFQEII